VSYPHIFERAAALVCKHFVELVKRLKALDNVAEHRMPSVEVIDVVRKCNEELASAASLVSVYRGRDGHRDGSFACVLELWSEFWFKVSRNGCLALRRRGDVGPYAFAACTGRSWIAALGQKVF